MPRAASVLGQGLAAAFLAGEWEQPAMTRRGQTAVGQRRVWVRDLANAVCHAFPEAPRDRPRELAAFITRCPSLTATLATSRGGHESPLSVRRWYAAHTAMREPPWPVARLDTVGDLRDLLGVTTSNLAWFADVRHLERHVVDNQLRHYRYRWTPKGNGGVRLIEEPKSVLKHFQRVLLREVLAPIPPHSAAHGFRPGRSTVTYASVHTNRAVIMHLDLEDFFGYVTASRVYGIFRACGYPEDVAHKLTGLVTNSVPSAVWATAHRPSGPPGAARYRLGRRLAAPHLPQGAPSSPALANLAAFRLDRRLATLAAKAGLAYSRYADDLALSSPTPRSPRQLTATLELIRAIASEEGFRVNEAKTTVRRAGQHQRLAGIVVNDRINGDRRDYEQLKAILTNAVRHGPASQNRRAHPHFGAHLRGRVAWVEHLNPSRGQRLRTLLSEIDWSA